MVTRNSAPATRKRTRSQPGEEPSSTTKKRRTGPSEDKSPRLRSSVYDVPDSGDENGLTASAPAPRRRRQKPKVAAATAEEVEPALATNVGEDSTKKKRGRPSKRDREPLAKPQNGVSASRNISARPSRGKSITANGKQAEDADLPKGILTPRKPRTGAGRPRKSVVFDSRPDEEALGELLAWPPSKSPTKQTAAAYLRASTAPKDAEQASDTDSSCDLNEEEALGELLACSPSKSPTKQPVAADMRARAAPKDAEQASDKGSGSDEEDEEVCAICSKPDSEPPNEIVFCDNCDMPVHQECYGLAEVPEGDWLCRNCSQEDASSTKLGGTGPVQLSVTARDDQRPDIPNFDQHIRSAQRVLLDRCAGRRRIKLRGQDQAYEKAYQLVEQTVVAGEGNSMMVIGARGCGKTTLVESVIADLSKQCAGQFHVVRLSGFIHTDDKLALREIWRQLGKEMEVEEDVVNKTTNHADTMASLLALLSHPSEIAETQAGMTSKSIVFVIDEFDLFATHARQTLLYNLFDIAQARKAPIAVLGLTTRIDVVESLEKRVKSRFSHRYVYMSLPKSLPAYWDVCKQGLVVDEEDMTLEGIDPKLKGHSAFWLWWNGKIESLYKTQSFTDHLESHFCSTKSVSAFLTTCILPLAALSPTNPSLQIPPAAGLGVSLEPPDSKLHLLGSLSDLDLSMLIAAARLDIVAHTDTVNFAMAYDEYTSLMGKQRVQSASAGMLALGGGARVWGRGTAGIAWERLVALGLLVPAASGGRGTAGLGGLDAKMWKMDVALEEIPAAVKLNAVLARWCREI